MSDVTPMSVMGTERIPPDKEAAVKRMVARLALRAARAQRQRQNPTATPATQDKSRASD